jgi:hypothetical protein
MAESPLSKKLKIKPGQQIVILNVPESYFDELNPLPEGVIVSEGFDGSPDWVQIFVRNKTELEAHLPQVVKLLKPERLLWISFPKGSSKIQTDLTRDKGWEALEQFDLKWINLVSVNEVWSAFSLRLYKPGEARQTFR